MLGVRPEHLPRIIGACEPAGTLTAKAAEELGLKPGTLVFGGGGDASLIGVGSGCVKPGKTHIYSGTSGWVSTVVEKRMADAGSMMAAVVGVQRGRYNYFAEMETAGKCLEWVKDHLALDEIGVYLESRDITSGPGGGVYQPVRLPDRDGKKHRAGSGRGAVYPLASREPVSL